MSGYLEPTTKQQIVFHISLNYCKADLQQSTCYLQPTLMDLHLMLGGRWLSATHLKIPQKDAVAPDVTDTGSTTPKSLTADR